jgi:transcriptional regulator with XRE-family HTH domain
MVASDPGASFAEFLRDQRRAAGLTQEELAERAGVSPRSVTEMERGGAHIPRRDTVALMARALGLEGRDR